MSIINPNDKQVVANKGVKLRNKGFEKAEQEKLEKEEYKKRFEQQADKTIEHIDAKQQKSLGVVSKFMQIVKDKTLDVNKGPIAKDVEREIRQEFVQLVIDLNNDETEENNDQGSTIAISILTKIALMYRDQINNLEYELSQIKKDLIKSK